MASNLLGILTRQLAKSRLSVSVAVVYHRRKSDSAKAAFKKLFPRFSHQKLLYFPRFPHYYPGKRPQPKYDADSSVSDRLWDYGQAVAAEIENPVELEKIPRARHVLAKVKREHSKGKIRAVSVEEVNSIHINFIEEMINILKYKEAQEIKIFRLPDDLNYADYFVIANGKNSEHLKQLTLTLSEQLTATHKNNAIHIEGLGSFEWMVVDAGSVVTHLFLPHVRDTYSIEKALDIT